MIPTGLMMVKLTVIFRLKVRSWVKVMDWQKDSLREKHWDLMIWIEMDLG